MTGSSAETATRDMRRFIEISFGYIAWMSAVVLVVAGVQAIRVGLFSLDHAILLAGAVLSIVSGTYLYFVHVRRVDQSSPMTHLSLSHAFLIGGAETCVLFFGLYLLLFRGLYRLYVLVWTSTRASCCRHLVSSSWLASYSTASEGSGKSEIS